MAFPAVKETLLRQQDIFETKNEKKIIVLQKPLLSSREAMLSSTHLSWELLLLLPEVLHPLQGLYLLTQTTFKVMRYPVYQHYNVNISFLHAFKELKHEDAAPLKTQETIDEQ